MTDTRTASALSLVKQRLNRLPEDTSMDLYLTARIHGAEKELSETGIHLDDSPDDLLLLVDYTVWQYQSRDQPGAMPDWLRLRRRERWLRDQARRDDRDS